MAFKNQISVNIKELEKCEKQLGDLAASLANKQLKISMFTAMGDTSDQLRESAAELRKLSDALQKLVTQTQKAVNSTRVGFEDMDEKLAAWFGITEE